MPLTLNAVLQQKAGRVARHRGWRYADSQPTLLIIAINGNGYETAAKK
jgi:hypothetical protein